MIQVLSGFATIWVVIGVGMVMAHLKLLDLSGADLLSKLAFRIGLPCLMVTTMAKADLGRIFSTNVAVSFLAVVVSIVIYLAASALVFKRSASHRVIGCFGSCYVNAQNMGLPMAAYVLGDTSWVAPILILQVAFLQPIGLTILDVLAAKERGIRHSIVKDLTLPLRNPMTVGVLVGLLVNLLNWRIPPLLATPVTMMGNIAVPSMLLAFGISLRLGERIRPGRELGELAVINVIKLVIQPVVAVMLARLFGLDAQVTLAVAVMAGLPTAQNVFVSAMRHHQAVALARNVVVSTTLLSIPTLTALAAVVNMLPAG